MTFRELILLQTKARKMSLREFADFIGVASSTVIRAVDERNPTRPGLDFMLAFSKHTKIPIDQVITIAYPEFVAEQERLSADAELLAQRIKKLPEEKRRLLEIFLNGL